MVYMEKEYRTLKLVYEKETYEFIDNVLKQFMEEHDITTKKRALELILADYIS